MLFFSVEKNMIKRKDQTSYYHSPPDAVNEDWRIERASYVTSFNRGSLTVEASLVLPLFIFGVTTLIFLIQVMQIQIQIQKTLYNETMKVTGYGYYLNSAEMSVEAENFLSVRYIKLKVIEALGDEFFENNTIVKGKKGFVLYFTNISEEGMVDVVLLYSLKVPFDIFGVGKLDFIARAKCAVWTGTNVDTTEWDVNMVYMTMHGQVYHCDRACTYIKSDISECWIDEIDGVRNSSGGKYYPCNFCSDGNDNFSGKVYFTQYGTRYHKVEYCGNLKSNVFAIEEDEAKEKYSACSKCGIEGDLYD